MKLDSSPTPPEVPAGIWIRFFRKQIITAHQGPSTKVPISSGRSERSSLRNEGTIGIENSMYCRTIAIAVSIAVTASFVVRFF